MPQGVGGVTDFARDFTAGAGIVQAAWARQERLMQLRGQEAQRALQERQLVAEIERWDQQNAINQKKLQIAEDEKKQDAADLLTARDYQMFLTEVSGLQKDEAAQASLELLTAKNPRLALQVAKVHTEEARAKAPELAAQSRENVAQINAESRKSIASTRFPKGYAPSVAEKDALALQKADDDVDAAYADGDEDLIARAVKFRDNLQKGMERQHPDQLKLEGIKSIRAELATVLKEYWSGGRNPDLVPKINELKRQLDDFRKEGPKGSGSSTNQATPRFKLEKGLLVPAQ